MIKFTDDLQNSKLRVNAERLVSALSNMVKEHPELRMKIESMDRESCRNISVCFQITDTEEEN